MHHTHHNASLQPAAPRRVGARLAAVLAAGLLAGTALAQAQAPNYPITAAQRATAQQVAQDGVPLDELAPGAPDVYVVKRGDTLWGISGMYLRQPWRWPALWGMNLDTIANPHLIYPGQTLYLEKAGGRARLRTSRGSDETIRVSPRTRYDSLSASALPTLQQHLVEPFLVHAQIVDELAMEQAPRIVATRDQRVLMSSGDRAYARGPEGSPLQLAPGVPRQYQIFRNPKALKDPQTGEVLGWEAQYVGRAELVRSEGVQEATDAKGRIDTDIVPATVDLISATEEVRAGDRLLPAPERSFANYTPHAPTQAVDARVVSIYGDVAVYNAGNNQVVTINRGSADGMQPGTVLTLLTEGRRLVDKTDDAKAMLRLPSEANGQAMVFRSFDRVSYALILQSQQSVRVGDRLVNPE